MSELEEFIDRELAPDYASMESDAAAFAGYHSNAGQQKVGRRPSSGMAGLASRAGLHSNGVDVGDSEQREKEKEKAGEFSSSSLDGLKEFSKGALGMCVCACVPLSLSLHVRVHVRVRVKTQACEGKYIMGSTRKPTHTHTRTPALTHTHTHTHV